MSALPPQANVRQRIERLPLTDICLALIVHSSPLPCSGGGRTRERIHFLCATLFGWGSPISRCSWPLCNISATSFGFSVLAFANGRLPFNHSRIFCSASRQVGAASPI
jgi:hypothetical protein